jgi:hypothetical protein
MGTEATMSGTLGGAFATVGVARITDYGSREESYYGGASSALALAVAAGWMTDAQRATIYANLETVQAAAVAAGIRDMCPSCGHLRDLRPNDHGELVCADCDD